MGADKATGGAPPVEMIDVVDADNRVVDTLPRAEVHRRGLRHRAVHMLVVDRAGRLYLQRRAETKDVDEFVRVYRGVTAAEPRPDPREIIEGGWWSPADIEQWLAREPARFTGTFKLIFAALRGPEVGA